MNRLELALVRAQERVISQERRWHELRATRDRAFKHAHAQGVSAGHIAALTGLSVSRVHMIISKEGNGYGVQADPEG